VLDLPQVFTLSNGTDTYVYDADGRKLRKVSTAGTGATTDYIDGIEYDTGVLEFIQTAEGRALYNSGSPNYEYNLTDHLGDVRLTFDAHLTTPTVDQQDDYMPFGYEISRSVINSPKNEYLYNKKELQGDLQVYDYGARFYDPLAVRWTTIDPLAESDFSWLPYNYCVNNPVLMIDPNGMGHFDSHGNYIADPSDNDTYKAGSYIRIRNPVLGYDVTYDWTGSGWQAYGDAPNWFLASLYEAYTNSDQDISQGAYGRQVYDWSRSWAGFQYGAGKMNRQLNVAVGASEAAVMVMGGGLTAGEAGGNLLIRGVARKAEFLEELAKENVTVFRVFGGDSAAEGFSWTPKNPNSFSNFRDVAGLPSGGASGANNTARFVIEGVVKKSDIILKRAALALDGNKGGLIEYIINPAKVVIKNVSGVNPQF